MISIDWMQLMNSHEMILTRLPEEQTSDFISLGVLSVALQLKMLMSGKRSNS